MGSLEEEMMFMDSEPAPLAASTNSSSSEAISIHQPTCQLLEGILSRCTAAEIEIFDKALKYVKEIGEDRKKSSLKKRLMMRLRKDGYDASLCRSSWVATMEYPGGDYEYIDIQMAGDEGATTRLILDVDFRSQFELARPTSSYTQLSNTLPPLFVGTEEKLRKVVSLLCLAGQKSLKESGLHIPPWRKSTYMQCKWLPCCTKACIPFPKMMFYPKEGMSHKGKSGPQKSGAVTRKGPGLGSGLSSQFSGLGVNCC